MTEKNITNFIPLDLIPILKEIGKLADKLGLKAYAAGGFVRDILLCLNNYNYDLDIVIEGDAIAFAKEFAFIKSSPLRKHEKFGTAAIILLIPSDNKSLKIDMASSRLEYYESPAALPQVKIGSIEEDLFRRDFTINTLLIELTEQNFGDLIDLFYGRDDIEKKTIRVLHDLSFQDDPTRIFRAIRFEQRFGFTIDDHTSHLIKDAVEKRVIKFLSGKRLFAEIKLILEEENPLSILIRANDYHLLEEIHPLIKFDDQKIRLFSEFNEILIHYNSLFANESYSKWAVYFLFLIHGFKKRVSEELCLCFQIKSNYKRLFCDGRIEAENFLLCKDFNKNILYKIFSVFKTEILLYIAALAKDESVREIILDRYVTYKNTKVFITGDDLIAAGLKPSPIFSQIMDDLFDAKMKGEIKTKKDEIKYIEKYKLKTLA